MTGFLFDVSSNCSLNGEVVRLRLERREAVYSGYAFKIRRLDYVVTLCLIALSLSLRTTGRPFPARTWQRLRI